jgi:hypothetical protein
MAYIPATSDGRGRQTYLQRPRFLALSEFGPRSLVYHEGRAFRVVRAMLSLQSTGTAPADVKVPTKSVRICIECGAGHWAEGASTCHACGTPLGDAEVVKDTYRIENVSTLPTERITANDEERQRQGFELQTTFEWATRDHALDVRRGSAVDANGAVVTLSYGAGATITRLNKGLRRRRSRTQLGFMIDPVSGYWAKNEDEDQVPDDPTAAPRQRIVPSVQDRKNALLLQPAVSEPSPTTMATVQHALLRGIEAVFQLEEGEILAEPMPNRDARTGYLFYEATEGGAGVLTRLVAEPERLAEVARAALSILHFACDEALPEAPDGLVDRQGTACVAACYRCLMSYYNQPDHESLDRRDAEAKALLLRLARARLNAVDAADRRVVQGAAGPVAGEGLTAWLALARTRGLPTPDSEALTLGGATCPLVWRAHYVVAIIDPVPTAAAQALANKGFELVELGPRTEAWAEPTDRLALLLGRGS